MYIESRDQIVDPVDKNTRDDGWAPGLHIASGLFRLTDGSTRPISKELAAFIDELLRGVESGKVGLLAVQEELLSPEEAARTLRVSRPTIYAWQDRGLLERVDIGNRRMVPTRSVDAQLHEQAEKTAFRAAVASGSEPDQATIERAIATIGVVDVAGTKDPPRRPRRRRNARPDSST